MVFTEFGMTTEDKPQSVNAPSPMVSTLLPKVTEDRLPHLMNAFLPMVTTESGMITEVRS